MVKKQLSFVISLHRWVLVGFRFLCFFVSYLWHWCALFVCHSDKEPRLLTRKTIFDILRQCILFIWLQILIPCKNVQADEIALLLLNIVYVWKIKSSAVIFSDKKWFLVVETFAWMKNSIFLLCENLFQEPSTVTYRSILKRTKGDWQHFSFLLAPPLNENFICIFNTIFVKIFYGFFTWILILMLLTVLLCYASIAIDPEFSWILTKEILSLL